MEISKRFIHVLFVVNLAVLVSFGIIYEFGLTCIIHKLSITMLNYWQNTSVLIKSDLKIVHYFLHQICLRLLAFFDI
jgi:hypothetical protein